MKLFRITTPTPQLFHECHIKLIAVVLPGKLSDAFSSLAKKSNFRALSKKLNLVGIICFLCLLNSTHAVCQHLFICVKVPKSDEEYDLRVPRDMAYIFSGAYVPLSCKLVEQVKPAVFCVRSVGQCCPSMLLLWRPSAGVGARRLDGAGGGHQAAERARVRRCR